MAGYVALVSSNYRVACHYRASVVCSHTEPGARVYLFHKVM